MLVCNISLRGLRRIIAADLAEGANAQDAATSANVLFAAIVDDPAAVFDFVDAYFGDPILEAASAADVIVAGLRYTAAIAEAASSASVVNATSILPAVITEAASAADVPDGITAAANFGAMLEAATATDAPDATRISGVRSRMVIGNMINTGASRQARAEFVMINE